MSFIKGPVPARIKIIQGFGAVAFGVKDNGFSFFLLIFYNQVLGMDAGLVGAALGLALIADALFDPFLGYLSDRTYTRWGRRLPWLYAAPLPLAVLWVILWSPPGSSPPSFFELLGFAIGVRMLLSACEVPSVSLLPEITSDYDERTTLFRFRYLFGWSGGLMMMVLAYFVFMRGPQGILSPDGYVGWGIAGAIVMIVSVIGSAAGLHSTVAHLPAARPAPFHWRDAFAEIFQAFGEHAFLIFAIGAAAAYISQGLTFSISQYVNTYVWLFDERAFQLYPIILMVSVVLMFLIVSPLHSRFGKPASAAGGAIAAVIFGFTPYALFLIGVWPQTGSAASTALYYLFVVCSNTCGIVTMISASSMIAEIIELFQEKTGRRAEGAFYSGNWLVQKCATGAGIFLSGQIIHLSRLQPKAVPGEIELPVLATMILLYAAASVVLALVSAIFLARFPITREDHEARVAALDAAALGDIDAGMTPP